MGKGANEPVTDTHRQTEDDAEPPKYEHSKPGGYVHIDEFTQQNGSEPGEQALSEDHKLALEKQKKRRERKPLLYCKIITRWPLQSFCKFIQLIILLSVTCENCI